MTKNKFTAEQVVRILQEAEAGEKSVTDICRERGITKNTFYAWKKRYGGMEAADIRRLRELEEENHRLKQMYAELSLDHRMLKEVLTKKL